MRSPAPQRWGWDGMPGDGDETASVNPVKHRGCHHMSLSCRASPWIWSQEFFSTHPFCRISYRWPFQFGSAKHMEVWKWGCPQIIHFNRIFHYKPSSYGGTKILGNLHIQVLPGIESSVTSMALAGAFSWGTQQIDQTFEASLKSLRKMEVTTAKCKYKWFSHN
jgi:hypothetical protein